jgi:AraC-like DNA-binding protein
MRCHLSIYRIQFFTEPARSDKLRPDHHFLILNFGGLQRGHFAGHDFCMPDPFMAVTLAHETLSYSFNDERRNWIISFRSPDFRAGRLPGLMDIRHDKGWFSLPRLAFLSPADVLRFDEDFRRLELAFSQPTPVNLFRVEAGMLNLFRYFAERDSTTPATGLAAVLKTKLEDRQSLGKRISDLGAASGYSQDYPSLLFKREFGTSPLTYRNRYRMQLSLEMLAEGKKSIHEIARELGFKHLSHFSGLFRRTFGLSPREARHREVSP